MIWGRWEEPNRRVRATDPDGQTLRDWVTSARDNSDAALRDRLERRGYSEIQISEYDFEDWKRRARKAAERVSDQILANKKPLKFSDDVYHDLKQHLFDISNDRCAYCEAKVKHIDNGDVEHFRPKATVREDGAHKGYYWLAYEPANMLPSCTLCNRPPGKHDQFPVESGTRVAGPESPLDGERPLLFNPYHEDPREHLEFLATGDVAGRTTKGELTIKICRLRRLREERREAMETLARNLETRRIANGGKFNVAFMSLLNDLLAGGDEYCNALLDHLARLWDEEEEQVAQTRKARELLKPGQVGLS